MGGVWENHDVGTKMISVLTRGKEAIRAVEQEEVLDMFCPSDLEESHGKEVDIAEATGNVEDPGVSINVLTQESGNTRPTRQPIESIDMEVEEHSLTHCPYRSWCKICVEAQGKEDPHVSTHECSEGIPRFSMDYKEMGEYVENQKKKTTTLVMRERDSTMSAAFVVKAKGSVEQAKRILESIESFGHGKVSIKSDNEDAIKVLRDEVIHLRKGTHSHCRFSSIPSRNPWHC